MSDHDEKFYKEMAARGETSQGYHDFGKWLSEIILAKAEWLGLDLKSSTGLKVLDYAAGPGVVSKAIGPYASQVVAVDSSTAMMEAYAAKFKDQQDKFSGHLGDLVGPEDDPNFDSEQFRNFDLVIVSLAFHHFDDPSRAAKKLAARLKEGGVLLIFEFKPGGGNFQEGGNHGHHHHHSQGHDHDVGHGGEDQEPSVARSQHMGFTIEGVVKLLEDASFKDVATFDPEVSLVWKSEGSKAPGVMDFGFVRQKDIKQGDDGNAPTIKKDLIMAKATKA